MSDLYSPELPPLDFTSWSTDFVAPGEPVDLHARHHSNSVPSITYQHHDSVSSMHSDGSRTAFPYFDSSVPVNYAELEDSHDPLDNINNGPRRATDPTSNAVDPDYDHYSVHNPSNAPRYAPQATSPRHGSQEVLTAASEAMQSQGGVGFGTSILAESLRSSSAQERRRRARARFELGND